MAGAGGGPGTVTTRQGAVAAGEEDGRGVWERGGQAESGAVLGLGAPQWEAQHGCSGPRRGEGGGRRSRRWRMVGCVRHAPVVFFLRLSANHVAAAVHPFGARRAGLSKVVCIWWTSCGFLRWAGCLVSLCTNLAAQ